MTRAARVLAVMLAASTAGGAAAAQDALTVGGVTARRADRHTCGEIVKGIDDDAQSTRVRSIGRSDGGLAGVGRLGSSVNHRLA